MIPTSKPVNQRLVKIIYTFQMPAKIGLKWTQYPLKEKTPGFSKWFTPHGKILGKTHLLHILGPPWASLSSVCQGTKVHARHPRESPYYTDLLDSFLVPWESFSGARFNGQIVNLPGSCFFFLMGKVWKHYWLFLFNLSRNQSLGIKMDTFVLRWQLRRAEILRYGSGLMILNMSGYIETIPRSDVRKTSYPSGIKAK